MNRKRKMMLGLLLVLVMAVSAHVMLPASGKDMNLPPGADNIDYDNCAGSATFAVNTPLPPNYPLSTTYIQFRFYHIEASSADFGGDELAIWLYFVVAGQTERSWNPFAVITTSAQSVEYLKTFWSGSFVEYFGPPGFPADNVILVSPDMLTIARHGNSAEVNLNSPQQIKKTNQVYFTLPAFSLDVRKVTGSGSFHFADVGSMIGWPRASSYTYVMEGMGFNADAVFSCTGLSTGAYTNTTVIMNEVDTFYPPA